MLLNEVDRDGDGCIKLEEFNTIDSAFGAHDWEAKLGETIDFFDSDRDGKIAARELLNVLKTIEDSQCTLEDCRRVIRGANRNGDGFWSGGWPEAMLMVVQIGEDHVAAAYYKC
ncbi:unnamed protein product [Fraxinus pennsylvanica]|uniref:EF-hand domain-containing protein n=1 Tax=Fraxinus pennsylvanica TaxID=56036 RepID=A0AAD1Z9N0_9LAMI|nr:unnamed protein product [Fraxinus pennsylvanica]